MATAIDLKRPEFFGKTPEELLSGLQKLKKKGNLHILDPELKAACVAYTFFAMSEVEVISWIRITD